MSLVRGVGTNDVGGYVDGVVSHWYTVWSDMLTRCYWEASLKRRPTYCGCVVTDEWKVASKFLEWFDENYVKGWVLDKDLLVRDNKLYGPDTCLFLPQEVNKFLTLRTLHRGDFPLGVRKYSKAGKYAGQASFGDGKRYRLGYFSTPEEAHRAWQEAKIKRCNQLIEKYSAYPKVVLGLQRVLKDLTFDLENKLITESL